MNDKHWHDKYRQDADTNEYEIDDPLAEEMQEAGAQGADAQNRRQQESTGGAQTPGGAETSDRTQAVGKTQASSVTQTADGAKTLGESAAMNAAGALDEAPGSGQKKKQPRGLRGLIRTNREDGSKSQKKGLFTRKKSRQGFRVVRIEDIEKADYNYNQEDTRDVLSTYIPVRRAKLIGRALLRLDRMRLFLMGALMAIALLFVLAFMQERMGNFTINLDRLELFRKGIAMSADPEFTSPTARLVASHVEDATNISIEDLPFDIADVDGGHNGRNYMAYTYYVRNAGKEDVDYIARVTLDSSSKGAEEAARVAVWRDGVRTVYAWPSASGEPEQGCVNFESPNVVCSFQENDFKVGYVNKYTVVIWMEGDDPECIDDIIGGAVEFSMNIVAADNDETTLFAKFIQDIKDSISGDRPIGAAGTDAPDYFKYQDVNWYTRRNGGEQSEGTDDAAAQ